MKLEDEVKRETNQSSKRVGEYLLKRASEDPFVKEVIGKEDKSLKGCWDYIVSEAKKVAKHGSVCLEDSQVFYLAQHYYQESDEDLKKCKDSAIPDKASDEVKEEHQEAPKLKKTKINKKAERDDRKIKDSGQLALF